MGIIFRIERSCVRNDEWWNLSHPAQHNSTHNGKARVLVEVCYFVIYLLIWWCFLFHASILISLMWPRLVSSVLTISSHYGWKLFISNPKADYLLNQWPLFMTIQYKLMLCTHMGSTESTKFDLRNKALKQIKAPCVLWLLNTEWCHFFLDFISCSLGTEQYSKYSGYAESYKWKESHTDETPR